MPSSDGSVQGCETLRVYLDDERRTPDGWTRTYTVEETIEKLKAKNVASLSLDNDLGSLDPNSEGYNVLLWLEEVAYFDPEFPIPEIFIHSSNAGRTGMMRKLAAKLMGR